MNASYISQIEPLESRVIRDIQEDRIPLIRGNFQAGFLLRAGFFPLPFFARGAFSEPLLSTGGKDGKPISFRR